MIPPPVETDWYAAERIYRYICWLNLLPAPAVNRFLERALIRAVERFSIFQDLRVLLTAPFVELTAALLNPFAS